MDLQRVLAAGLLATAPSVRRRAVRLCLSEGIGGGVMVISAWGSGPVLAVKFISPVQPALIPRRKERR
jgi:hypothetical protein